MGRPFSAVDRLARHETCVIATIYVTSQFGIKRAFSVHVSYEFETGHPQFTEESFHHGRRCYFACAGNWRQCCNLFYPSSSAATGAAGGGARPAGESLVSRAETRRELVRPDGRQLLCVQLSDVQGSRTAAERILRDRGTPELSRKPLLWRPH